MIQLPRLLDKQMQEVARLHPVSLSLDLNMAPLSTATMTLPEGDTLRGTQIIMGNGKRIEISLDWNSGRCSIRDYGRGIPLGKVVDCVSELNTGGIMIYLYKRI